MFLSFVAEFCRSLNTVSMLDGQEPKRGTNQLSLVGSNSPHARMVTRPAAVCNKVRPHTNNPMESVAAPSELEVVVGQRVR